MLMLIAVGSAATLSVLFLAFAIFGRKSESVAQQRLSDFGAPEPKKAEALEEEPSEEPEETVSVLARLGALVAPLAPSSVRAQGKVYDTVRQRLVEAGIRGNSALSAYYGSRVALSVGLGLLVILAAGIMRTVPAPLAIGLAAGLGYLAPGLIVDRMRSSRQESIRLGLPDAIDLMVVCVESGLGLTATLARVASEFKDNCPIVAAEFQATVLETDAGRSLTEALRSLGNRTGAQDLNVLISLMLQTDRFGTPMDETRVLVMCQLMSSQQHYCGMITLASV